MKKLIFTLFAASVFAAACNNTNPDEKARQDSIEAAAQADSILNSAMQADTSSTDTIDLVDTAGAESQ